MPYEEEEDRVCEVKCPKGGGVCGIGSIPILTVICNARWGLETLDFPNGIPLGRYGRTARASFIHKLANGICRLMRTLASLRSATVGSECVHWDAP